MLGEVVMNYYADGSEIVKYHLEEKQHQVSQELSKSMRSISVAASVAPLLGLLGTVSGMVHTFEIIEMFGFGNPVLLADGISEALLTTQAGLLVAFPLMLAYNHLSSRIERMEQEVWGEILKFEKVLQENLK
ncbi:MAG: MotA/TolQ/ExbB proton channel family protein [Fibrobacteraceae bacterium]|nr:MotA/TolQ/ExbB proton channel family protein [Fibrobacteraceae bacterium]